MAFLVGVVQPGLSPWGSEEMLPSKTGVQRQQEDQEPGWGRAEKRELALGLPAWGVSTGAGRLAHRLLGMPV